MDITYNKKGKKYILGTTEYTKQEFISYIESDMLSNALQSEDITLDLDLDEKAKGGYNKIYYGCPGCGKSHIVKEMLKDVPKENKFRVTFHPEYSNYDFVGQVMPKAETITNDDGTTKDKLTYEFFEGPFTLALKRANEVKEMVYLVIEEINRGNAAAIFGDLFQLLDRIKDSNDPNYLQSEYSITNTNIQKALKIDEVVIPSNLAIIGTMNTSDQNVFTLDTAFKRRWEFEHVDNEFTPQDTIGDLYIPGTDVTWKTFVKNVNDKIAKLAMGDSISDDKRIGKYFVSTDLLEENSGTRLKDGVGNPNANLIEKAKKFAYKVLEYIWDDVAKYDAKADWFDTTNITTLEKLIDAFINTDTNNPVAVFGDLF